MKAKFLHAELRLLLTNILGLFSIDFYGKVSEHRQCYSELFLLKHYLINAFLCIKQEIDHQKMKF